MLAAPAATAGAICVDRARGTLAHMLATDLSDPEIVLGKLAARLLPVLGLVACSWPVLALSSLLGGIDPQALTLAFAIILAVALLGCSMALALSVWARKPHEVVLVVYTFWALVLLLWPIWYGAGHGEARRPAGRLEPRGEPVLPGVRTVFRARSGRFLGLSRFLRRDAGGIRRAGGPGGLADAARRAAGDRRRPQGAPARLGRPADAMAARPGARRQSRALARVASVAAVALDDDPDCAGGRLDRRRLRRRRRHCLDRRAGRASGRPACGADRGNLRRDPAVDLRPADALGRGADVDGRGAAAGQPRPPGRDHALHPDDRPGQVAGDAASSRAAGDRARDCWDSPWPWPSRPRRRSRWEPRPGTTRNCPTGRCSSVPAY